jgi:hypothetical protein
MRICWVFNTAYFFRYFDGAVRHLRERGHEVVLVVGEGPVSRNYTDRAVEACVAEAGCRREPLHVPRSLPGRLMPRVRDLAGYANYFRPGHPAPGWTRQWRTYLDKHVQRLLANPVAHRLVVSVAGRHLLRSIDRLLPANSSVAARVSALRPDVLVATPMVFSTSRDVEYVKAARSLGIPTVFAVGSWDHLGGKGLCPVVPDAVLVWNEEMAWEAATLHDIPRERIAVVGAPSFDFWFDATPTTDRDAFLGTAGLDADSRYFVYVCSSNPIAGDTEPGFVAKLADAMIGDPRLKGVRLLVRPYPAMNHVWNDVRIPNGSVWPPKGEWPDIPEARQNLFHTLYFSVGAIGVNTTAMLEAAVVGRPCISILTDEYRRSQVDRAHFQQMLRGDFLETPRSPEEAVEVMAAIVEARDAKTEARRAFVRRFFRPLGDAQQVATLYAETIERAAARSANATRACASTSRASALRPP